MALDINPEHARPWITAAAPTHPSLIDTAHVTDELFGFMNVPMCVWVDEDGMIVRPAEVATIETYLRRDAPIPDDLPDRIKQVMVEVKKLESKPDEYRAAIRDWVAHGAGSAFALSPDEVVARSGGRPIEHSTAAAYFELGQHLFRHRGERRAVPCGGSPPPLPGELHVQAQPDARHDAGGRRGERPPQGPNYVYDGNGSIVRAIGGGRPLLPTLLL